MTGSTSLVILLMLLAAVFAWLLARTRRSAHRRLDGEDIDHDVLEQAEQELSDLDALADPEDADDHLPDWGPGAPK